MDRQGRNSDNGSLSFYLKVSSSRCSLKLLENGEDIALSDSVNHEARIGKRRLLHGYVQETSLERLSVPFLEFCVSARAYTHARTRMSKHRRNVNRARILARCARRARLLRATYDLRGPTTFPAVYKSSNLTRAGEVPQK